MEAAGLAVGVVGLAGILKNCLELFATFNAARELGRDYSLLETKLDVEKYLLLQWADRMRLTQPDYDCRLDDPTIQQAVSRLLGSILFLLSENTALQSRYGLQLESVRGDHTFAATLRKSQSRLRRRLLNGSRASPALATSEEGMEDDEEDEEDEESNRRIAAAMEINRISGKGTRKAGDEYEGAIDSISGLRMRKFVQGFRDLQARMSMVQHKSSALARVRWIITDKDKFDKLVQELSHFILKLNQITPAHPDFITGRSRTTDLTMTTVMEDVLEITSIDKLRLIRDASHGMQKAIAAAAERRLVQVCFEYVLDHLWFVAMDERREGVADAHFKTLHWALKDGDPRSRAKGQSSGLPEWLTSGSGIYWLSGKAGSGKSTLMKYLYDHPHTAQLLSRWADPAPLAIGSFFFWNLGSPEQKSQAGLSRAVLYQLLKPNPSLIPELLPRIWREVYRGTSDKLTLPSTTEISTAFKEIAGLQNGELGRRFCFFLDGLDEYSGDYFQGISFIKQLSRNPAIKMVVSSRPIPACVDAFNNMPRLQLENFTRHDIKQYVHDTVGTHPYMATILRINYGESMAILDELVSKASGVFLWVVLACRSLLSGFAAYDRVRELRRRVDELPAELEDMFKLMLTQVEARYSYQMAKMLRVCYQLKALDRIDQRVFTGVILDSPPDWQRGVIHTASLAYVDDYEMDLNGIVLAQDISEDEILARCKSFEGRLRSRCGGLLEITIKAVPATQHSPLQSIFQSRIDFMHRSVFEFLDNPDVWQSTFLEVQDAGFDANAILSMMSLYEAQLGLKAEEKIMPKECLSSALIYLRHCDRSSPRNAVTVMNHVEDTTRVFYNSYNSADRVFTLSPEPKDGQAGAARVPDMLQLLLAVELGMTNFTRHFAQSGLINPRAQVRFPLLYHATDQFLLRRLPDFVPSNFPVTLPMVNLLLSDGCPPNAGFVDDYCCKTTPWRAWLRMLRSWEMRVGSSVPFSEAERITELFLQKGADPNAREYYPDGPTVRQLLRNKAVVEDSARYKLSQVGPGMRAASTSGLDRTVDGAEEWRPVSAPARQ